MKLGNFIRILATTATAIGLLPAVSAAKNAGDSALRGVPGPPEGVPEQAQGEPRNPAAIATLNLPDDSKVDFYEPEPGILLMGANLKGDGLELMKSYNGKNDPADLYMFLEGTHVIPGQLQAAIARSKSKDFNFDTLTGPPEGVVEEDGEASDLHDRRHRDLGISESVWVEDYCKGLQYEISDTNCKCLTFRTGGSYWEVKSKEVFMRTHAYLGAVQQRVDKWNGSQWVFMASDSVAEGYTYWRSAWSSSDTWWKMSINYATGDTWHAFYHKKDSLCCDRYTGLCIKPLTCSIYETCPIVI